KAQLLDNEENVLSELEGSYPEILQTFKQLSEEDTQETEEPEQYEDPLTNSDFRGVKVKVLEDITYEYDDTLVKGTITTDVNILLGDNFLIIVVLILLYVLIYLFII